MCTSLTHRYLLPWQCHRALPRSCMNPPIFLQPHQSSRMLGFISTIILLAAVSVWHTWHSLYDSGSWSRGMLGLGNLWRGFDFVGLAWVLVLWSSLPSIWNRLEWTCTFSYVQGESGILNLSKNSYHTVWNLRAPIRLVENVIIAEWPKGSCLEPNWRTVLFVLSGFWLS